MTCANPRTRRSVHRLAPLLIPVLAPQTAAPLVATLDVDRDGMNCGIPADADAYRDWITRHLTKEL
jgi:hypothetical protein